ncbi:helix-turn-helix domain-containing protein [Kitasatospora cinereorecta]|uniref:Helix-turn-helix domain-containing protein n=1 Tax=Kitasatospora cinereorecta TaxID=285560 RepID=A0ABW0VH52_9ACTN
MSPEQLARATELLADPAWTITAVAKELGVSRATLYYDIPGLRGRPRPARKATVTTGR